MVKYKHFEKVCIAIIILAMIIAGSFGLRSKKDKTQLKLGYENRLFDTSKVHTIDIKMDNWEEFLKKADAKNYTTATVTVDGEIFENVGLRTKGGSSLEDVSSAKGNRYSLKVKFNKNDKKKKYHGLDTLNLNNMIFDKTYMKDHVVYNMMRTAGVAAPLTSYSYVTVNGKDIGLYMNVENVGKSFLKRNYGSSKASLYKPESGGGFETDEENDANDNNNSKESSSNDVETSSTESRLETEEVSGAATLKYFDDNISSYQDIFDSAKTKVTEADKQRLIKSLQNLNNGTKLSEVLDTKSVMNYFVVHNFVSNDDGYTSNNVHNYYLYEKNGRMSMLPWDYNLAFGTMNEHKKTEVINQSIDSLLTGEDLSTRPMFAWMIQNKDYKKEYHRLFQNFMTSQIDSGAVNQLIDQTAELIKPYIEKDPTKFYKSETFPTAIRSLKTFMDLRSQKVKKELSGDTSTVNASSFKMADLGLEGDSAGPIKE